MTISLYAASIPVYKQMLNSLADILKKAEAHAAAKNIDPNALLQARLYPDMFALLRQVQVACDFARSAAARLSNTDIPKVADDQQTFADLQKLLTDALAFIDTATPAKVDGQESREIITRPGTPHERKFTCQTYLLSYALPQFFFHVTTAYDILRHNGVEIGKKDYMGAY
ncbi:MAG TPA: DUF1993 domain-containing protein [Oxalicibacterium sp.]